MSPTQETGKEGAERAPGAACRREAEVPLEGVEVELHRVREPPLERLRRYQFLEARRLIVVAAEVDHQVAARAADPHPLAVLVQDLVKQVEQRLVLEMLDLLLGD